MLHFDEARQQAIDAAKAILATTSEKTRAVLIDDLFGRIRLVLWAHDAGLVERLAAELQRAGGEYWSGEVWDATHAKKPDREVYERAWKEAVEEIPGKLRVLDRHRSRGAWLAAPRKPPWKEPIDASPRTPPIVVFYSFKGGVGRSTALAAFAVRRARQKEKVVVVDADLDAPGVGTLLAADIEGTTARWGVVDYLLESGATEDVDLQDYYHACRRETVTGAGQILVIPAGRMDESYLGKLARVDFEPPAPGEGNPPLHRLLEQVRSELRPNWILIDARAGLADPAGMLLGGLAHLHVLFGTFSEQSWRGLRLVVDRLGARRVHAGDPQADCLIVHAMVPESTEVARQAREAFAERSRDEFTEHYYAEAAGPGESSEGFWDLSDADGSDAPHVPIALTYSPRLADFRTLDDVADALATGTDYQQLEERITARFGGGAQ